MASNGYWQQAKISIEEPFTRTGGAPIHIRPWPCLTHLRGSSAFLVEFVPIPPLHALVTLNDPAFWEAAQALAANMQAGKRTLNEQIVAGYRMALARDPDPQTLATLVELAGQTTLPIVANTILNLDEYLTKE